MGVGQSRERTRSIHSPSPSSTSNQNSPSPTSTAEGAAPDEIFPDVDDQVMASCISKIKLADFLTEAVTLGKLSIRDANLLSAHVMKRDDLLTEFDILHSTFADELLRKRVINDWILTQWADLKLQSQMQGNQKALPPSPHPPGSEKRSLSSGPRPASATSTGIELDADTSPSPSPASPPNSLSETTRRSSRGETISSSVSSSTSFSSLLADRRNRRSYFGGSVPERIHLQDAITYLTCPDLLDGEGGAMYSSFVRIFFRCYRAAFTSEELLRHLTAIFQTDLEEGALLLDAQAPSSQNDYFLGNSEQRSRISSARNRQYFAGVAMIYWVENYWPDFLHLRELLNDFIQDTIDGRDSEHSPHSSYPDTPRSTPSGGTSEELGEKGGGEGEQGYDEEDLKLSRCPPIIERLSAAVSYLRAQDSLGEAEKSETEAKDPSELPAQELKGGVSRKHSTATSSSGTPTHHVPLSLVELNTEWFSPHQLRFRVLDYDPYKVAQQLTLIHADKFQRITPEQFVFKLAGLEGRHPAIDVFIEDFNVLCFWVASQILSYREVEFRTQVFEKFVELAHACFELDNFHATFAICSAFELRPIARLRHLRVQFASNRLQNMHHRLQKLTSPSHNYATYRNHFRKLWRPCPGSPESGRSSVPGSPYFVGSVPTASMSLESTSLLGSHSPARSIASPGFSPNSRPSVMESRHRRAVPAIIPHLAMILGDLSSQYEHLARDGALIYEMCNRVDSTLEMCSQLAAASWSRVVPDRQAQLLIQNSIAETTHTRESLMDRSKLLQPRMSKADFQKQLLLSGLQLNGFI